MANASHQELARDLSTFWSRVKSYTPARKPVESLFEKAAYHDLAAQKADHMDARARQAFLIARIAATGMAGR